MNPRAILITGANGGIGAAPARLFLERDETCHVYLRVHSGGWVMAKETNRYVLGNSGLACL